MRPEQVHRQHPLAGDVVEADQPPGPGRVAAQADRDVGGPVEHRAEQRRHVRVPQADEVGVEQQHRRGTREQQPGAERAGLAAVPPEAHQPDPAEIAAGFRDRVGGGVGRPVVDDDELVDQRVPCDGREHPTDPRRLVERRDHAGDPRGPRRAHDPFARRRTSQSRPPSRISAPTSSDARKIQELIEV